MSKSILSNERVCYVCRLPYNLHRHHIFFGHGNRNLSEKYGCWVYLCARHHNMSNKGVHFNKELDLKLKERAQIAFEIHHGSRSDFIKTFGRNYLDEIPQQESIG